MKGIGGSSATAELSSITPWADRGPRIDARERLQRIERARALMAEQGMDLLLINAGNSLRYFTGVPWGASERLVAMLLPRDGEPVMICPGFELGSMEAVLQIPARVALWEEDESPYALVAQALGKVGGGVLGIDPETPFFVVSALQQALPDAVLRNGAGVIEPLRMIKSGNELRLMRQAKAMTLEVHRRTARILKPGILASEVRKFIDDAHRAIGADGGSSFCIVQFGMATSFPHGVPGDQALAEGDMVLIDTGCLLDGYNADITRSYVYGDASPRQRQIWAIEQEAQLAAFDAVRPGAPCESVDAAARAVLEKHGLGPDYRLPGLPHRTGHGIGLSVHERAYLVRGDRTALAPGMCFSNEPMIVIPGEFGIRLEDHFHVTATGAAWFTQPSPAIDAPFG